MNIEIVSYVNSLSNAARLHLTAEIINHSISDVILFSGHTIGFVNDIEQLKTLIKNKRSEVILELEDINSEKINNCLYKISKGVLYSLNTNQIFTKSGEIEGNYELANRLLYEFETKRTIKIKDISVHRKSNSDVQATN